MQVVDDGPVRRLLFPGDLIQSEQDTRAPDRLQLGYTHAIHGAACRARALERVLLIGVGGGSLVRSVHRVAPGAAIDAVELHRPVLELARRWFGLPAGPGSTTTSTTAAGSSAAPASATTSSSSTPSARSACRRTCSRGSS